ncbi:hypothetical protein B7494_g338 [Chlorociboria aeruginascens]|nr:hypothetical protein B7494_g338 [Chlorociboria aeruginascens]
MHKDNLAIRLKRKESTEDNVRKETSDKNITMAKVESCDEAAASEPGAPDRSPASTANSSDNEDVPDGPPKKAKQITVKKGKQVAKTTPDLTTLEYKAWIEEVRATADATNLMVKRLAMPQIVALASLPEMRSILPMSSGRPWKDEKDMQKLKAVLATITGTVKKSDSRCAQCKDRRRDIPLRECIVVEGEWKEGEKYLRGSSTAKSPARAASTATKEASTSTIVRRVVANANYSRDAPAAAEKNGGDGELTEYRYLQPDTMFHIDPTPAFTKITRQFIPRLPSPYSSPCSSPATSPVEYEIELTIPSKNTPLLDLRKFVMELRKTCDPTWEFTFSTTDKPRGGKCMYEFLGAALEDRRWTFGVFSTKVSDVDAAEVGDRHSWVSVLRKNADCTYTLMFWDSKWPTDGTMPSHWVYKLWLITLAGKSDVDVKNVWFAGRGYGVNKDSVTSCANFLLQIAKKGEKFRELEGLSHCNLALKRFLDHYTKALQISSQAISIAAIDEQYIYTLLWQDEACLLEILLEQPDDRFNAICHQGLKFCLVKSSQTALFIILMDFDEIAEASHEASCNAWFDLYDSLQGAPLSKFVSKFRDHQQCWQQSIDCGSFNFCCRFAFADGVQWMLRFPMPGRVMYLAEQVKRELGPKKYILEKTKIPTPKLIAYGMEDDLGLGPFVITEFIKGKTLDKLWKENPEEPRSGLRSDIDEKVQEIVYRQVANILLELAEHKFDRIGSLSFDDGGSYSVTARPLTLKMNEVARVGGVVNNAPFESTSDYFNHIGRQNLDHLLKQRNSIDDADDARRKYINRHLFQAITPSYISKEHNYIFTLFCDDFRPSNFILDNDLKLWWIDLEWTYAAPYQMLYSPPRWLLLRNPCRWSDIPDVMDLFKVKFEIFHGILVEEESKRFMSVKTDAEFCEQGVSESEIQHLPPKESFSSLMRKSMEDGKFWYHELIRESFDFDDEFLWTQIAQSSTLSSSDVEIPQGGLDSFVASKMAEMREYEVAHEAMMAEAEKAKADKAEAGKEKEAKEE